MQNNNLSGHDKSINRRGFLHRSLTIGALPFLPAGIAQSAENSSPETPPKNFAALPKIKLGVIGCGGRGAWIARLFQKHGGYEMHAVADYFQEVADQCGDSLNVHKQRRFSGLSGYQRLLESGVEAVACETPPYFFPEHVSAAVQAGKHVYLAKPIAVDVPGCQVVKSAAQKATTAKKVFLVDYQIPTDAHNLEVVRQIREGAIGPVVNLNTAYIAGQFPDPEKTATIESRLQRLTWCNDVAMGGGYHVNACIHAVDAGLWVAGRNPISATGMSAIGRPNPHGDSHDIFSISFDFGGGLILNHRGKHISDKTSWDCSCQIHGQTGFAVIGYVNTTSLKGPESVYRGEVQNLYEAGAVRNIATFHESILQGKTENQTVQRAVDSALMTILGREVCLRKNHLTLEQLLKENRRLEVNLAGLKA